MDRTEIGPDGKPCKACISVDELMKRGREMAEKKAAGSTNSKAKEEVRSDSGFATTSHDQRTNCPVDKDELGRSTWNLLHTMSVYYPEVPSEEQKQSTRVFLDALGKNYPCDYCAKDLRKDLVEDPPKLSSRNEFANWMCRLHNKVNDKTGKPIFDCSKVFERWKDGWKDGSCDF